VRASGPTAIAPAVEIARGWLRAASSLSRRHVLLLSDGRTSQADAVRLRAIADRRDIEISTVALGGEADHALLASLAQTTGGRAYFPGDIRELPGIVARESARVGGGRVVETTVGSIAGRHQIFAGLRTSTLPPLGGYVVSAAKASAESPLQSSLGDPVLATWRVGLGRAAVYTAEMHGEWSSQLREWDDFDALLTRICRWASRSTRDISLYATFAQRSDGLQLIVEAADDSAAGRLRGDATVRAPDGGTTTLRLRETAPGRYETVIAAADPGAYVFSVSLASPDSSREARIVRGLYWSADLEYHDTTPNERLLSQLAALTGGRVLTERDDVFAAQRPTSYLDAWRWLALAALCFFLLDTVHPAWGTVAARLTRRRAASAPAHEAAA
jgi:hypothetical protein